MLLSVRFCTVYMSDRINARVGDFAAAGRNIASAARRRRPRRMVTTFTFDSIYDDDAAREAALMRFGALSRLFDVAFAIPGT